MNQSADDFDWNQAKAFLATAECGSLSAAARALKITQPTVGRQIAALEDALGVVLFDRVGRSLVLTDAGLDLLEHVRVMGESASLVSLSATGRSESIEGQVCITATDVMSVYHLPPIVRKLREHAPQIEIELLSSNRIEDLRRREADIAIRHVRPEHPELIARRLRDTEAYFYASDEYLQRAGCPQGVADLERFDFVGFEDPDAIIGYLNNVGVSLPRPGFRAYSNNGIATWELVKQGLGIGMMLSDLGDTTPGVQRLLADEVCIPIPLWLTSHRELHTSRRIRLVYDFLGEALAAAQ